MKKGLLGLLTLFILLLTVISVSALSADFREVEINGVTVTQEDTIRLDIVKGGEIEVRVEFEAQERADVRVEAKIFDPDGRDIEAETDLILTRTGRKYSRTLTLATPTDFQEGEYRLRLRIADSSTGDVDADYTLYINSPRHNVFVQEILSHPFGTVTNKDFLFVKARIGSTSQEDEENIRVKIFLENGPEAVTYIDEIQDDDSGTAEEDTEEMLLALGCHISEGPHKLKAEVTYDRGRKTSEYEKTIFIQKDPSCDTPTAPVRPATPPASTTVKVSGTAPTAPANNVVTGAVPAGGLQPADSGDTTATDDTEDTKTSTKKVLEVLLIILVVLFILIAIIVAIYKLRGDDE